MIPYFCVAQSMKKNVLNILLSVLVSLAVLFLIWIKIRDRVADIDFGVAGTLLFGSIQTLSMLLLVFLLMPVNLLCEALKWKTVCQPLYPVSLGRAYSGILSGITAGLLLPNRVGEFAGKALVLPLNTFWKASALAVFTSMTQLLVTLLFGFSAFFYWGNDLAYFLDISWIGLPWLIAGLSMLVLLGIFFSVHKLGNLFIRWPRIYKIMMVFDDIHFAMKIQLLSLSILRYFVFASQNLLLLFVFDVPVPLSDAFFLITLMYFIMTALPTIVLTDLPVRGSVMLLLFISWFNWQQLQIPPQLEVKIILVSLLIWLFNLVLPAIPGLYFLNKYSLLRKEEK